jgi:hypothetical protein
MEAYVLQYRLNTIRSGEKNNGNKLVNWGLYLLVRTRHYLA